MTLRLALLFAMAAATLAAQAPEDVYRGELLAYPDAWAFQLGKQHIIFVRDDEVVAMATDPDRVLNLATGHAAHNDSLRQICERAKAHGQRTLSIAFDHFFAQYRPGQQTPRKLMPDSDAYIQHIATISRFAAGYGLGLELSLLTPLEVGTAYKAQTGETGVWMQYREGMRDPNSGAFSVNYWQQRRWANNKGTFDIEPAAVRAFAFRERPIGGTPYRVVAPADIVEITAAIRSEVVREAAERDGHLARYMRVWANTLPAGSQGLDRVFVVQTYRTPEMDYFSPKAAPFLHTLIDRYASAGVKLNGLYSDEMHIQQDWNYFGHHDNGEFAFRYVSPHLGRVYAGRYGAEYADFAKYLVYFAHGQEDFARDLTAKRGTMHVFGASPEDIRRTALFRARYYHLLQDSVVDLFVDAKHYAERKMGRRLESRYHATWAQSPTIDNWDTGRQNGNAHKYEYTSNFIWSNTVQQAASACADYFKWGEFLLGTGNDHTEGGWLDRNYYGLAMACSTGSVNEVPYSYAAHWGMPADIHNRRTALVEAYGAGASPQFAAVQNSQHRNVDVLMLYPLDLVAVEERFGSWMTQYGYANMLTAAKLVELGRVDGAALRVKDRTYTTLYVPFEPFPSDALLALMERFAAAGGRIVWSGPPPMLTFEGKPALPTWQRIFGAAYAPTPEDGLIAAGRRVTFEGALGRVAPQTVLTDFLVDRIYPVTPIDGAAVVARVGNRVAGVKRGNATYLGFRPRDDQSQSLGYDERTLFSILFELGAYPGKDNTEAISRTGPYLSCRFPNGAVAVAAHLRELEEAWPGGFSREAEADRKIVEQLGLKPNTITLTDYAVNGFRVTYTGHAVVSFRASADGALLAFAGHAATGITINGRAHRFAEKPIGLLSFAPVAAERRVNGGAVLQIFARGQGRVRIPFNAPASARLFAEGAAPGSRGAEVAFTRVDGAIEFDINAASNNRWLYLVP